MFDADVVSGDSGGAVLDSEGEVVGLTTAATTGSYDTSGYAIDIDDALAVVDQIVAGEESGTVDLGYPAFLGVQMSNTSTGGVGIVGVVVDSPAAEAGLTAGSVVTTVDGTATGSADDLSVLLPPISQGTPSRSLGPLRTGSPSWPVSP